MVQSPHEMPAAFEAAFNRKDIDALLALYSDDAVLVADGTAEVGGGGLRAALERPLGWRYVIDAPFGIKL